jgi:O-antigen ligase
MNPTAGKTPQHGKSLSRGGEQFIWVLWLLLLVSIPVTSFPLVARLTGRAPVSPLSGIPLLLLVALWLLPYLLRRGNLPTAAWPLVAYGGVAIMAAAAASFLPLEAYKGQTPLAREVRALATLAIGLAFYFTASCLPSSSERLRTSLRALYFATAITLVWASVQAWVALDGVREVPWRLNALHRMISIRSLVPDRVTGLAYEPSWLANQLVVLFLPLLLASVIRRFSVFPRLGSRLSVEFLLLVWAVPILLLARSRIGVISFMVMLLPVCIAGSWRAARWLARLARPADPVTGRRRIMLPQILVFALAVLALLGVVAGSAYAWSRADRRLAGLFSIPSQLPEIKSEHPQEEILEIANRLAFAERVVYWTAGYRAFERYPWLGVGPGNAGFLFTSTLPGYGYGLTEIKDLLAPGNTNFPNPKNLWIRLLAETGVVGFALFVIWLGLLAAGAWMLLRSEKGIRGVVGLAGGLAILAKVTEGFSLDTFALPQLWVMMGILTAAIWQGKLSARGETQEGCIRDSLAFHGKGK